MITQEQVRRLFSYDPETGIVTRKITVSGSNAKVGDRAGCVKVDNSGKRYVYVKINSRPYRLHRVIWLYVYGELPNEIDHINGDGLDNRLCNLRDVTHADNCKNRKKMFNNISGVTGVHWNKRDRKWVARIYNDHKLFHLGYFNTIEEAAKVRKEAEIIHGFHANHGQDRSL